MARLRRLFGTLPVVQPASDTWQRTRPRRKNPGVPPPARRRLLHSSVLVTMSQFAGLGGFVSSFFFLLGRLEPCFKLISLQSLSLRQWRAAMSSLAASTERESAAGGMNGDAGTRCDNSGTLRWLDDTCGSV